MSTADNAVFHSGDRRVRPLALSTMVPWACIAALVWVSVLAGCACSESEPGPGAAPSPQAGDPRPARPPAPTSAETRPPTPGAPVVSAELRSLLDATALSDADTFKDAMQRAARLRDRALTRALVEALRSPDARVRAVAACGLSGIKDADSARGLRSFLAAHDPAELNRRVETGELSEAGSTMEVSTLRAAIATLGEIRDAEAAGIPIYAVRSCNPPQLRQCLDNIFLPRKEGSVNLAVDEAERAILQVKEGEEEVELNPQNAYIRRLQHILAKRSDLVSYSVGKSNTRRVRITKG